MNPLAVEFECAAEGAMLEHESNRMRILHVIGGLGPGGAETMMYRLVTRPSPFGHEVICLAPPDWYSAQLQRHGIKVQHLNVCSFGSSLAGVFRLARLIRKSEADVVQGWMYSANLLAGVFAKIYGIPSVWGIHNSSLDLLTRTTRWWVRASGWVAGWVPSYVINCSSRSAELHAPLGFSQAPGKVVSNGYDGRAFFPEQTSGARMREKLGIADGTFLIGSVARWHVQKDIPNLLRATRIAANSGVPVRCLLIGHELGDHNAALMEAIKAIGCEALAVPLGRRSDIDVLMRALDLHVLGSATEAFPNVVAEAMLSGTPCLVTDVGDAGYIVAETGWVARPQCSEQLAQHIEAAFREWSERPEAWSARCAAARARIVNNFTMDKMAEEYEAIWRSVARPRADRVPRRTDGHPQENHRV